MRSSFFINLTAAMFFSFNGVTKVLADVPATVQETALDNGSTEYTVNNTSSLTTAGGPFNITLLVVTTTGTNPNTQEPGWNAESLNAVAWDQSMGFDFVDTEVPTWQQYTGLSYTQAFPTDPSNVNGYFLLHSLPVDNEYNLGSTHIAPGTSLNGLLFTGSPASTFLVAGPSASFMSEYTLADIVTYSGTSTNIPEPAGLCLAAFVVCGLALRRRRTGCQTRRSSTLPS